jgi:hypothetical protein
MYCPECGADAGDANFCPECGADLRALVASPDCAACGSEVPEGANFCPECGHSVGTGSGTPGETPTEATPAAAAAGGGGGRRTGTRGKSAGAGRRQERRPSPAASQEASSATAGRQPGRVPPVVAWGLLGVVVVVAIVVVVLFARGADGGSGAPAPTGAQSQSARAVTADTGGGYSELVQRANGLYDQGAAKFDAEDYAQGAQYFLAASKVYAAAWKQQNTDPSVGTDFATSLFYSGDIDGAVRQVEQVLSKSPGFQTAWFNKGNYLAERARQAEASGSAGVADKDYAEARIAYQKAVDLDPASSSGQQAKERLTALPQ